MQRLDNCPICSHTEFIHFLEVTDYFLSHEKFQLVSCKKCSFVFTNPRPSEQEIYRYYETEEYLSHSNRRKTLFDNVYFQVKQLNLKSKLNTIRKYTHQPKNILDYGCGTGSFVEFCNKNSIQTDGIEPSHQASAIAKSTNHNFNANIYSNIDQLPATQNYDVITLWHVLEHIHQLNETFIRLKDKLSPNGLLIIALPNHNSYDRKHFRKYWAGYDVPRHLYHFDQKTFRLFAKKHGMNIKAIHPMYFDAFYVSMLSLKYIDQKNHYAGSFLTGLKSNFYGRRNDQDYSSLIYVLAK